MSILDNTVLITFSGASAETFLTDPDVQAIETYGYTSLAAAAYGNVCVDNLYSVVGVLPDGLVIDVSTGIISGTPSDTTDPEMLNEIAAVYPESYVSSWTFDQSGYDIGSNVVLTTTYDFQVSGSNLTAVPSPLPPTITDHTIIVAMSWDAAVAKWRVDKGY